MVTQGGVGPCREHQKVVEEEEQQPQQQRRLETAVDLTGKSRSCINTKQNKTKRTQQNKKTHIGEQK